MLITHATNSDLLFPADKGRGAVPRDYTKYPVGYLKCAPPAQIKLIPQSEWSDRIKERARLKSRISDLRRSSGPNGGAVPSLDQGQWGYCWAHSTTMAHMLLRAAMMQPYVKLSAFAVASIIQNYKNEGLWGAASLAWVEEHGQPTDATWPEQKVSPSLDTPAMRAEAARYKIVGDWADLQVPVYDRTLSKAQVATLLLSGCPVVADYNWWGHSVCLMDLVEIEKGHFGVKGLNSWSDQWGDLGEFTLDESKAWPDGAVAPTATMAA